MTTTETTAEPAGIVCLYFGREWDGKEPAQAWFDRVEAADRAAAEATSEARDA